MNSRQEARNTMRASVLECMQKYQPIWAGNPGIVQIVAKLQQIGEDVNTALMKQNISIPGLTKEKAKLRSELVDIAFKISGVICVYARSVNNKEVFERFDMTIWDFVKIRDMELPAKINDIQAYISAHMAELADYGLTPALASLFNDQKNAYAGYMVKPLEAKAARAEATKRIDSILRMAADILKNESDKAMLIYRDTEPEFYIEYRASRSIYDNPSSPLSMKGIVRISSTGVPLAKVAVTIVEPGHMKFTGAKGNYRFQGVKPGKYSVRFEKTGYNTIIERVIIDDKTKILDVKMVEETEGEN